MAKVASKTKKPRATKRKPSPDLDVRHAIIETARAMSRSRLSPGRTGNVSARFEDGLLITPSGIAYDDLKPADIVFVRDDGHVPGRQKKPSSEWRFHQTIYAARSDQHAIVHTHSMHATVLACAGRAIPAFHYMVAVAGGNDIPLVPYATFGTQKLADDAAAALTSRNACLLANHGAIAIGTGLEHAFELAWDVEILAEQYFKVLAIGQPNYLLRSEMAEVLEKFSSYGQHAQKTQPKTS